MSLTYLAFQKKSSYFEKYPRETFSPDAGQRSRSIIPGDDPGDQEPSERRGFYPEPHAVVASAPTIKQVKGMSESQTIAKPWRRKELDQYVSQRIRECTDAALVLYQNDDDGLEARLREGGETMLWTAVQEAIADAGWQVAARPK